MAEQETKFYGINFDYTHAGISAPAISVYSDEEIFNCDKRKFASDTDKYYECKDAEGIFALLIEYTT